jgi:hypothetical protein
MLSHLHRVIGFLLALCLVTDLAWAGSVVCCQQPAVPRFREFTAFSSQAFSPAYSWVDHPLSTGVRPYRHAGSNESHMTDYSNMSAAKFGRILDEMLAALGMHPRAYKHVESNPRDIYKNYRALYKDINFLFQLANPTALIPQEDYWATVFVAVIPYLQADGTDVRLGTAFNRAQANVLILICKQYNLTTATLESKINALKKIFIYNTKRRHYSEEERQFIAYFLRSESEQNWSHFVEQVRLAFPQRGRSVNEEARTYAFSKKTALTGIEWQAFLNQLPKLVQNALLSMTPRQEEVIKMRFGLEPPYEEMSGEEVAQNFCLSRERIRQIEVIALRRLRYRFKEFQLNSSFPELPGPKRRQENIASKKALASPTAPLKSPVEATESSVAKPNDAAPEDIAYRAQQVATAALHGKLVSKWEFFNLVQFAWQFPFSLDNIPADVLAQSTGGLLSLMPHHHRIATNSYHAFIAQYIYTVGDLLKSVKVWEIGNIGQKTLTAMILHTGQWLDQEIPYILPPKSAYQSA